MRRMIVVALVLVAAAAAWGMDKKEAAGTFGVTEAWVVRAQQAVAWSQGKQAPVSVDEVVAEMVSRMNAIVVQQEQSHGIDPATGEADPVELVRQLQAERSQKEAAQAALVTAVAEVADLKAAAAEPVEDK
jgi:hypothetical protein